MPLDTKQAMFDAVQRNEIIVGGYTDGSGGVCPMLAAHRNGGRTNFASFARAWDRYTRAKSKPRPASEREVRTLKTMLEASIAIDDVRGGAVFGAAIADHRQAQAERARREEHEPVEVDLTALARRMARLDPHAEQDPEDHPRPAHA
jgi:ribosomal protein S15P/S13E